jgi:hypothetical protein
MHSSISSSEVLRGAGQPGGAGAPDRYARQTAADRPGVAQPVPLRPVPAQPWGRILIGAVLLLAVLVAGWEAYWRAYDVRPGAANSYGLWAIQRRRIDAGEGDATVLLGDSRLYFDTRLPLWERLDGRRPIQLSFEGTSPRMALEDLAADPKFTGRVVVGISPQVFFLDFGFRAGAIRYAHKESPSQRIGQWLSMHLIEPYFAFDDSDYALQTVLARQPWPARPGRFWFRDVRKLSDHEPDRNTYLWDKVSADPQYRAIARGIWAQRFNHPEEAPPPAVLVKAESEAIDKTAKAVAQLRARGVKVLFVRLPSSGAYLEFERKVWPRARTWDKLLSASGAPGIHFEDYPEMQGFYLPEWSHMTLAESERFTPVLYNIIQRDFWGPHATATAAPVAAAK